MSTGYRCGGFGMNVKTVVFVLLVFGVFLVGCAESKTTGYAAYNQPQQGQQPNGQPNGQYVGGGCGVAPSGAYENTPAQALNPANFGL